MTRGALLSRENLKVASANSRLSWTGSIRPVPGPGAALRAMAAPLDLDARSTTSDFRFRVALGAASGSARACRERRRAGRFSGRASPPRRLRRSHPGQTLAARHRHPRGGRSSPPILAEGLEVHSARGGQERRRNTSIPRARPHEEAEQAEALELVTSLLNELDPDKRELLVLSEFEEMSALEIAAHLGVNSEHGLCASARCPASLRRGSTLGIERREPGGGRDPLGETGALCESASRGGSDRARSAKGARRPGASARSHGERDGDQSGREWSGHGWRGCGGADRDLGARENCGRRRSPRRSGGRNSDRGCDRSVGVCRTGDAGDPSHARATGHGSPLCCEPTRCRSPRSGPGRAAASSAASGRHERKRSAGDRGDDACSCVLLLLPLPAPRSRSPHPLAPQRRAGPQRQGTLQRRSR